LAGVAYLGAALVLAGALVYFPRGSSNPGAVAHRGDKVAATAMVAAGLVSPLILVGVAVTVLLLWFMLIVPAMWLWQSWRSA